MSSKLREALNQIHKLLSIGGNPDTAMCIRYEAANQIAKEALAEPLRNCDVGTAAEQKARYEAFCKECQRITRDLPCDFDSACIFKWGQMPYKEESK